VATYEYDAWGNWEQWHQLTHIGMPDTGTTNIPDYNI